jgi:hypothetical protein
MRGQERNVIMLSYFSFCALAALLPLFLLTATSVLGQTAAQPSATDTPPRRVCTLPGEEDGYIDGQNIPYGDPLSKEERERRKLFQVLGEDRAYTTKEVDKKATILIRPNPT